MKPEHDFRQENCLACLMRLSGTVGLCLLFLLAHVEILNGEEIDYSREIRPLLARKCYACHGPDAQESGLALHERERVFQELDSGEVAVRAGKPDQSSLIARIRDTDDDLRMPPSGHDPLKPQEIELLERWIEQGAKFNQHWAFEKLTHVDIPPASSPTASSHPIDRFIDEKLQKQGIQPSPPADKRTLIRRLSYDLTGLPPVWKRSRILNRTPLPRLMKSWWTDY